MGNWDDAGAARRYHEATKHSFVSVRTSGHRLDWENRPHPFKEYLGLDLLPLPPGLERLLRLGAGVVRTRELPGGDVYHFRTYASAGALYPVEVYVVAPDGVFHFHPLELGLRRLRAGDWRRFLAEAAVVPEVAEAGAVLVLTGIMWRTAWKYGARGYRHLYWDAGTMLANLLALGADEKPRLLTGFVDADVNRLVDVDGTREAALALLAVGRRPANGESDDLEPLAYDVAPLSRVERSYPEAEEVHAAASLRNADDVRSYRGPPRPPDTVPPVDVAAGEPLEAVIRRRGSARNFGLDPMARAELAAILAAVCDAVPADVPPVTEMHLVANAVGELDSGAYRFEPPDGFDAKAVGDFRWRAGYLALEQAHAARAAATEFLLADLGAVLAAHGNRGYRAAQLEAGIRAGRLYLGAYARRLGATGLTFYDDDVARFFTGGVERQPMLCVALGPTSTRPRVA